MAENNNRESSSRQGSGFVAALGGFLVSVFASVLAAVVVAVVGPFIPAFDVDRRLFFTVLIVVLVAYVVGALSYAALTSTKPFESQWWVMLVGLSLVVVTLPALVSVSIQGEPVVGSVLNPPVAERPTSTPTVVPSQSAPVGAQRTREVELPVDAKWDVEKWQESDESATWDVGLSTSGVTFRDVAEAKPDWTLADCENPDLRAWAGERRYVRVTTERDQFCFGTTTGRIAMLKVRKTPTSDQLVKTWVIEVTDRS